MPVLKYRDPTSGAFIPVSYGGVVPPPPSMNDLQDADTSTNAPNVGDSLVWDGTNWVPGDRVNTAGDTMTGNLTMAQHGVIFQTADASIVQSAAGGLYVADAASTASKPLGVGPPTEPGHATTKEYVDWAGVESTNVRGTYAAAPPLGTIVDIPLTIINYSTGAPVGTLGGGRFLPSKAGMYTMTAIIYTNVSGDAISDTIAGIGWCDPGNQIAVQYVRYSAGAAQVRAGMAIANVGYYHIADQSHYYQNIGVPSLPIISIDATLYINRMTA